MPLISGKVATTIPSETANAGAAATASDEFGAVHVRSEIYAWAEQGTYFRATNPTLGTGIAMGIQTAWSATANVLFLMRNGSTTKKIIPHYLRLICTAAGATTTSSRLAIILDTANRYSSGGTDLTTAVVNSNSGQSSTSAVDVLRYNCTAGAAVAPRQIANLQLKTATAPCWVVGDEIKIAFRDDTSSSNLGGTTPTSIAKNVGPVVLEGQNHCLLVHMWNPANATTAPSWEFELAWWER